MPYFLLQSLTKMSKTIQKQKSNEDKSLYHFGLIKILIEFELQGRGKTWKEFLISNQIKEDEQEQQQERTDFMLDIDKEIPECKSSNVPQPSSGVRTRRMRQETAKKIEKDKIFTTYKRRSRRIKRNQTQDDQPELMQMHQWKLKAVLIHSQNRKQKWKLRVTRKKGKSQYLQTRNREG